MLEMGQTHVHKNMPILLERIERGEIDSSLSSRTESDWKTGDVPHVSRHG